MKHADITRHLQYFGWCYFAIAAAVVILWTSVYGILEKPNANEKLTISYFGNDYDGEKLENDIKQNLSNITEQQIKEVTFDHVREANSSLLGSMIQTRLYSSDIMIFPNRMLDEEFITLSFRPLSSELEAHLNDMDAVLYKINGVSYGIVLNNTENGKNNFSKFYAGEEELIAFFAPYCENLGAAYGLGSKNDRAAIDVIKYFLEGSNG